MGRKNIIRILVNSVSLVSYHKLLHEKGNKLEAKKHLEDEIRDYSTEGFEKSQLYKFNKGELDEIKEKSIKRTKTILKNRYPDIKFSEEDIQEKVVDTMQEFLL